MGNFCQISTELWHLIYDTISFLGAILRICRPICFKLCKGVHIWKVWFGIIDECHQDMMCICTELNLRDGVSYHACLQRFYSLWHITTPNDTHVFKLLTVNES